jgi:hypothetical protein
MEGNFVPLLFSYLRKRFPAGDGIGGAASFRSAAIPVTSLKGTQNKR